MICIAALAGAAALVVTAAVSAQPPQSSPESSSPESSSPGSSSMAPGMAMPTDAYVKAAARSDEFEIGEARMALHHTGNPHIRRFAKMMIHDHTQSTDMIKAALSQNGQPVSPPPSLSPDQRRMMAALHDAGPSFDRVYIDQQVQAHAQALQVHQGYAEGGQDPALKRAARMIVPVVRRHLSMAQDIQSHLG